MITYNEIYEAARKERYSEKLQSLPKKFISQVSSYLQEKKDISAKENDTFSEIVVKTKKQLENAITLFKELMLRRRKKILSLVLIAAETGISKQDFNNMLPLEKDLFEELMKCIDSTDKKMNEILNGKKEETMKNDLIIFKKDIEEIMGLDGNLLGPFREGQIANIPKEVAKILIDDNKAEHIIDD